MKQPDDRAMDIDNRIKHMIYLLLNAAEGVLRPSVY